MISIIDAHILIRAKVENDKKYIHSVNVAELLYSLASYFNEDKSLWYLTGLLHDIDLKETRNDMKNHGLLAEKHLLGLLPTVCIEAIRTHEPTTGLFPNTNLGHALVFADNFDNLCNVCTKEKILECIKHNLWNELKEEYANNLNQIKVLETFLNRYKDVVGLL